AGARMRHKTSRRALAAVVGIALVGLAFAGGAAYQHSQDQQLAALYTPAPGAAAFGRGAGAAFTPGGSGTAAGGGSSAPGTGSGAGSGGSSTSVGGSTGNGSG